jgi:hypothetical protein
LDPEPLEETVTAYGGIPVFLRAARSLDVGGMVHRHVRLTKRERGLDEAGYVESFLVLKHCRRRRNRGFQRACKQRFWIAAPVALTLLLSALRILR